MRNKKLNLILGVLNSLITFKYIYRNKSVKSLKLKINNIYINYNIINISKSWCTTMWIISHRTIKYNFNHLK